MTQLLGFLSTLPDLALVILGFGFIIFIHELGHFVAAKWAGIRVLAFAVGFGRPILAYRKGMGVRWGTSSEPEYTRLAKAGQAAGLSPTEYRLNWMPLGGYVKMLGQEDLNPNAVSRESDSFQNTPPWKRMVVISAGVVMNVILAAVLFVIVFMTGLKTEPPQVGGVLRGSAAAMAVATNAGALGVTEPGLLAGDLVVEVNGREPEEFTDLVLAAAMARRGAAVSLAVQRQGLPEPLRFEIVPRVGDQKLLEIGLFPASTNQLKSAPPELLAEVRESLGRIGLEGVDPGMSLVEVDGAAATEAADLVLAVRRSGGRPVPVVFEGEGGARVERMIRPEAEPEVTTVTLPSGMEVPVRHLLGLTPVMSVATESRPAQGLEPGDIFARLGNAHYPSMAEGMAEIHAHRGRTIQATVLRRGADGRLMPVELQPEVRPVSLGQIGFFPDSTHATDTLLALPPRGLESAGTVPAVDLVARPGTRIVSIAGAPVSNFREVREALRRATERVAAENAASASIPVEIEAPIASGVDADRTREVVSWTLSRAEVQRLHRLGWASPLDSLAFEPKQFMLQASGPVDALRMGIAKTHRVMLMTYITFARLFEGTVKVEHLKGPVGIAQMGTRVAERGTVWLLFFMALISVNLAVINFLPLPIVDGGQFVFLVLEQIRGKPVSVEIQNVATAIGLLLIGTVFIVVTFHDIVNLFG
jgi:regulator of sigma E protease